MLDVPLRTLSQTDIADLMLERMNEEDAARQAALERCAQVNGLQVESLPSGVILASTPLETVRNACLDFQEACSVIHALLSEKARYSLSERQGWVKTAKERILAAQLDMRLAVADLNRLLKQVRQASASLPCW